jgi:hypothetical protein
MLSMRTWGSLPAFIVYLFGISLLLAGCGRAGPTPTPTPTSFPTLDITPGPPPTLPATWTPLPTGTPYPTATATRTPTPIPTLTAHQICNNFALIAAPTGQQEFDATVAFGWHGVPVDVSVTVAVIKHDSKEGIRLSLPVAGDTIFRLPLSRLPDEGDYDWTISLQHPIYGEICTQSGRFTRKPEPYI